MAKKSTQRETITLACQNEVDGVKCAQRNYQTFKNKRNTPERLELSKYCKWERKKTMHKEIK